MYLYLHKSNFIGPFVFHRAKCFVIKEEILKQASQKSIVDSVLDYDILELWKCCAHMMVIYINIEEAATFS